MNVSSNELSKHLLSKSATRFRQQFLLDGRQLENFCNDRGVRLIHGESSALWRQSWLRADELRFTPREFADGYYHLKATDKRPIGSGTSPRTRRGCRTSPLFHPFRIAALRLIAPSVDLSLQPGQRLFETIEPEEAPYRLKRTENTIAELDEASGIADLAILLEPLYWPFITSKLFGDITRKDLASLYASHRKHVLELAREVTVDSFKAAHHMLMSGAHALDQNDDVYLVLRLAKWEKREKLKGRIGGALWLRHIAEVIRRGCEEVHGASLPEEDEFGASWPRGVRTRMYGTERPLDAPWEHKRKILWEYGLDPSIQVRWYVEGDTEAGALKEAFGENPVASQVEIVNLAGAVTGKARGMLLMQFFMADHAAKRFSFVSIDGDKEDNLRELRSQVKHEHLSVGWVTIAKPDFEMANFDVPELVRIAVSLRTLSSTKRKRIREADWSGIRKGKDFDGKFQTVARTPALKGEEWGKALMRFALKNPERPSTNSLRPVIKALQAAHRVYLVDHKGQHDRYLMDQTTLTIVDRLPS